MSQKTLISFVRDCLPFSKYLRVFGCFALLSLLMSVIGTLSMPKRTASAFGAQTPTVAVVSAASFGPTLAPASIAAVFGTRLATQNATATGDTDPNTPGVQLPKQLGGTSIEIGGQQSELFFVSASQANVLIPANLASGFTPITVRAGDGTVSTGTVVIAPVAPALFSASSNGQGAPAGLLLRISSTGAQQFEALAQLNTQNKWVPKPFSFNVAGERLFLVLFLSGLRGALDPDRNGNLNETVHVLLGGNEATPDFVGKQGGLVGVDQVNVEIPRTLIGRGAVNLAVTYSSLATSNLGTIEIGGIAAAPSPVSVSSLNPTEALIGEEVIINGANFAGNPTDNQVFFVDDLEGKNFRATVRSATATQLRVIVPFGAGTGRALVRTPQSETLSAARLTLRTSISGFVEATDKQPLPGVAVRVRDTNISTTTSPEGAFILPNVPAALEQIVEIDPPAGAPLPFPKYTAKLQVRAGRDHHFGHITLQQQTGPTILFPNPDVAVATAAETDFQAAVYAPTTRNIQTGGVIFEVADNTAAVFPGGATNGGVQLDVVANSRTPAKLPSGVFSSTIAQLAPFGVKLMPGGKLTFPNSDNIPVSAQPKLYKLDQTIGSTTLGEFIVVGNATVSSDGRRVETAANAITETSLYFVAVQRPVTSVIGRVVEQDGKVIRNAQISARGQEVTTDGLGLYLLLNVPVTNANDLLTLEASFQRPGGRVDRVSRTGIVPVPNGLTSVTDLVLSSPATIPNRPPTLIAPPTFGATQNTPFNLPILASDPDIGQTIQVTVTGAPFASVVQNGSNYALRLTPGAGTVGNYTLTLRATDNVGLSTTRTVALTVFANRAPVLSVPGTQTISVGQTLSFDVIASDLDAGQTLTLTATGLPSSAAFNQTSATIRRFVWTPNAAEVGSYTVTFAVRDNGTPNLSHTKPVVINVTDGTGGTGLRGEYFDSIDLTLSKLVRTDATVDFNWGTGSPDPSINAESFSARWIGQVQSRFSETYTFYTVSGGGIRLWVNNQLLVDNWTLHMPIENSGTISLVANQKYEIRIEFYNFSMGAVARLLWSSPSQVKQIVPQEYLYPPQASAICGNAINLLRNADAEEGIGSPTGNVVTIPGWTTTSNFTAEQYNDTSTRPKPAESRRIGGGSNYFFGGLNNTLATATQTVNIDNQVTEIDAGRRVAQFQAQLAGYSTQADSASIKAEFLNSSGVILTTLFLGPVASTDSIFQLRSVYATVPSGTRTIRVTMISIRRSGNNNDGYFDNLFLGLCSN